MGFYVRKSFRLGPFRFNLSRSGIGVSVGVRGLRAGVDASGKGYIAGGRAGLYFRHGIPTTTPSEQAEPARPTRSSRHVLVWMIVAFIAILVLLFIAGR